MIDLESLLPNVQNVLLELIKNDYLKNYVLAGGSALSLYLDHRKSEDLNFFTYEDSFNKKTIFDLLKDFERKEIINISEEQVDVLINGVKVTFFNSKWEFLKPEKIENFNIAPIEVIAGMKVHTLFLRAKYRDYYDLYFLIKRLGLEKVFENSKNIVEGINFKLFSMALLYINDIEDDEIKHLNPKLKLTKKEIGNFFETELKKQK